MKGGDKNAESQCLLLIKKAFSIYISLSSVEELPDLLEEYLSHWMAISQQIIEDTGSSKAHLKLKSEVIKLVTLYSERFAAEFQSYLFPFFEIVWKSNDIFIMLKA